MRAFATLSLLFSSSALAFFHIFSGFSAMGCGASARVSDETAALPAAQRPRDARNSLGARQHLTWI